MTISYEKLKNDVIQYIQDHNFPLNGLSKVYSILRSSLTEDSVLQRLTLPYCNGGHNIPVKTAKNLLNLAIEFDCYAKLEDLLLGNQQFPDEYIETLSSGNVLDLVAHFGFPEDFIKEVWNIKDPVGGVATGSGEIFMIILFRNGHKPIKGDFAIGTSLFEVKVTNRTSKKETGFRLRGQKGYGIGQKAGVLFFSKLRDEICKLNECIEDEIEVPEISLGESSQLFLKKENSIADLYCSKLIAAHETAYPGTSFMLLSKIAAWYSEAFFQTYTDANKTTIQEIFKACIRKDGTLDCQKLIPKIVAFEFEYYQMKEHFHALICVNSKFDFMILRNGDINEELISQKFTASPPNTKSSATGQDSVSYISLL